MQVLRFDQLVNRSPQIEELCKCMICLEIFIDPMCCESCENHFCQTCLTTWSQNQSARSCPVCNKLKEKQGQRILKNMLNDLDVYCCYKQNGCLGILKYSDYFFHIKSCQFKQVKCEYEGCNIDILLKDKNQHDNICLFKLLQCKWCSQEILRRNLEQHEQNECFERKLLCSKCLFEVPFLMMQNHIDNCPENILQCQLCFSNIKLKDVEQHDKNDCPQVIVKCSGCWEKLKRVSMIQHMKSCQFVEIKCENCQELIQRKDLKDHTIAKCFKTLKQIITDQSRQIKGLYTFCEELSQQVSFLSQMQQQIKFSKYFKHKDIDVISNGKIALINQNENKKFDRLIAIKNSKNKSIEIEFLHISDLNVCIGITQRSNIFNPKDYSKPNHQSYLFCANGIVYVNESKEENGKKKNFGFVIGQKLELLYNDKFVSIKNCITQQYLKYNITYDNFNKDDIELYPVLCLRSNNDKARILN
ncbi:unnamed protein product [Paramecium sonneborni]|uniref:Uncharacterized protein n=1 Tax=Paramecium sonneborni TaxID=65129 RepID=A0A8S1QJE4_9CILI|nr:unnamed protein product [Paramecium sonneborni]